MQFRAAEVKTIDSCNTEFRKFDSSKTLSSNGDNSLAPHVCNGISGVPFWIHWGGHHLWQIMDSPPCLACRECWAAHWIWFSLALLNNVSMLHLLPKAKRHVSLTWQIDDWLNLCYPHSFPGWVSFPCLEAPESNHGTRLSWLFAKFFILTLVFFLHKSGPQVLLCPPQMSLKS